MEEGEPIDEPIEKPKMSTLDLDIKEWDIEFKVVLNKSEMHQFSYEEHSSAWMSLYDKSKAMNCKNQLLKVCVKAIATMPLSYTREEKEKDWLKLLNLIYIEIKCGNIDYNEAKEVFNTAEIKFANSYRRADAYWNVVQEWEITRLEEQGASKVEIMTKHIEIARKKFSKPFDKLELHWTMFDSWARRSHLSLDLKVEIQKSYYKSLEEASKIEGVLPSESFDQSLHHLYFDDWVKYMLLKSEPDLDLINVISEEMICIDKYDICYYHVYVDALTSPKFNEDNKSDKLFTVIRRLITLGKRGCASVESIYLEHALSIASNYIDTEKVLDLIELLLNTNSCFYSETAWFSARRGAMVAVRNMVKERDFPICDLKKYMKMCIAVKNQNESEYIRIEQYKIMIINQWLLSAYKLNKMSMEKCFEEWMEICMQTDKPLYIRGYCDFMRAHGTDKQINSAYEGSTRRVLTLCLDEETTTFMSREIYLQLIADYLNYKMINGIAAEQATLSFELSKRQLEWSVTYNEAYNLQNVPQSPGIHLINGNKLSYPMTEQEGNGTELGPSENKQKEERPIEASYPSNTSCERLLFLSNMHYKATEDDVYEAFQANGFNIVQLSIQKDRRNKSLGYATVELETPEMVTKALREMDRSLLLDRPMFVSPHRGKIKRSPVEPQTPTPVLTLSNIPQEWRDVNIIKDALTPYGRIKTMELDHTEESVSGRITFFSPMDAENILGEWLRGNILKNAGIIVSKGCLGHPYPAVQGQNKEKPDQKRRREKSTAQPSRSQISATSPSQSKPKKKKEMPIVSQACANKSAPFFVPRSVTSRTQPKPHMKARLELPKTKIVSPADQQDNNRASSFTEFREPQHSPSPSQSSQSSTSSPTK